MRTYKKIKIILLGLIPVFIYSSCTKLDTPVYSAVSSDSFWKTADQFNAGLAPIYTDLRNLQFWDALELVEGSTDELIVPTRGNDWLDNGNHQRIFLHTWTTNDGPVNNAWTQIFQGIADCNYIMNQIRSQPSVPAGVDTSDYISQLRIMRAYYYLDALDYFGNVPIVSSFKIDPSTVKNNTQKEVFSFIESELLASIPNAGSDVDLTTYGRANKWVGFAVLAKLYLNAQVYTGTARWADCAKACDSIILSGKYSLMTDYFDNFNPQNDNSTENILVVPFDKNYITGNARENATLHYNDIAPFSLLSGMYNGWSSAGDFYYGNYDTTSTYTTNNGKVYRTFNDQRTGQYLVGQQFSDLFSYPPSQNVLVQSNTTSDLLNDNGTPLVYQPNFSTLVYSTSQEEGRLVGARNIKYFPEAGTQANQSNDVVLFRLADIILMRAECILYGAPAGSTGSAVSLVNQIRTRAYGSTDNNWSSVTPKTLLAERARELAWEGWRRQDLIRYDVANSTNLWGQARGGTNAPAKPADPSDNHLRLFPIPDAQHTSNGNLVQNPGYPAF